MMTLLNDAPMSQNVLAVKFRRENGLSARQRKRQGKRMVVEEEEEEEEEARKEGTRDREREIDRTRPQGKMMR